MFFLRHIVPILLSAGTHLFVIFCIETILRVFQIFQTHEKLEKFSTTCDKISFDSSCVICNYDVFSNKVCSFRNVYFIKEIESAGSFIFIINKNSTILGLRDRNDFKTINLSSIKNHSKMFMDIIVVNNLQYVRSVFFQFLAEKRKQISKGIGFKYDENDNNFTYTSNISSKNQNDLFESNTIIFHEPIFVIRRFKCDNIMHVIHDDLLPLFVTYSNLCSGDIDRCISHYRLFFYDDCVSSEFLELYNVFSVFQPLFLRNVQKQNFESNKIYGFQNLRVGMDISSVWYNYGFFGQQGGAAETKIDSVTLEKFCNFLVQKLSIKRNFPNNEKINILILNRKINRKVINMSELKRKIKLISSEIFQKDVIISESDLYQNTVQNLVENILEAKIIVGMHSSSMILTIFCLLKGNTVVFELFPFSIQPKYVSFLYPLREVVDHKVSYKFWKNEKESNSVTHANNSKLFGGLEHLSASEQKQILETKLLPPVKCCHDPAYLFRMYQDTYVDQSFLKFYRSGIQTMYFHSKEDSNWNHWFFPARVSHIKCFFKDLLVLISWSAPKNVLADTVKYKIVISAIMIEPLAFIVKENNLTLHLNNFKIHHRPIKLSIWIKSFFEGKFDAESVDVYHSCAEAEVFSASVTP